MSVHGVMFRKRWTKGKFFLDLLNQIDSSKCSNTSTEHDLAEALRRSLLGRTYLILLDDVWDREAWDTLSEPFPGENPMNPGSRIIMTSRRHYIAPQQLLVDQEPYFLRQLNEKESLKLLQRELSLGLSVDLETKIAEKCRGLPLMILTVAGVLKHVESEGWDELLDRLSSTASIMEQYMNSLELSYTQLPVHLRPCLLYFGTFLQNQEVSVRRLLRLWIAEGFIGGDETQSPEDYLNDLISRSLVMVAQQRCLGGIKTCQIHDLIRDFCVQKAKDEHLFHLVRGYDELSAFNEPCNLQRLCIHSEAGHFKQSKLFCPSARSLILNASESTQTLIEGIGQRCISHAISVFKNLTVLDLEQVHLGYRFPVEIEQFVQLTFLAILCEAGEIPPWIGNLSGLETFIKLGDINGHLPDSIWNLQKLKYLYLGGGDGYYTFSEYDLDSRITLPKLERVSGVVIPYSKMKSLLRKFPNIRKLKCRLLYSRGGGNNLVFPNIRSELQSLSILYSDDVDGSILQEVMRSLFRNSGSSSRKPAELGGFSSRKPIQELSLPENLEKLTLGGFSLSSENMSTIGLLPNLKVLKLLRIAFEDRKWAMKEREFSKLKILKLIDSCITNWCSDEDADPLECLEKLVLEHTSYLEEIPSCLENIDPLAIIEVSDCYHDVLNLVEHIEERQKYLIGDSAVKIIRNNIRVWV